MIHIHVYMTSHLTPSNLTTLARAPGTSFTQKRKMKHDVCSEV